ncbi:hypothetical protein QNN00_14345 [Bacillus velezensis]|nr:hypothetical protein [Bacillus velezensis]
MELQPTVLWCKRASQWRDPAVIPLGTVVYIDGIGKRTVQDTGGGVKGIT